MKQAMGAGYHLLSFGHMMKSLDNCSRAIMVLRGHVDGQDETRVLFKPTAAERNRGASVSVGEILKSQLQARDRAFGIVKPLL